VNLRVEPRDTNRASFIYNYQKFTDFPDTLKNRDNSFPGFPVQAGQSSIRLGWSAPVRTVLRNHLVNEARVGYSGAPVQFFQAMNVGMFNCSVANQQGFVLIYPTVNSTLTSPGPTLAPQSRNANSPARRPRARATRRPTRARAGATRRS
jgi:hypothetical protein